MANDFYSKTGAPGTRASGSSSTIRAEFAAVEAGFDKLPDMTGNDDLPVFVNAGATAIEAITASSARTKLGLGIGVNVQAYDADLAAIAALTSAADKMPYSTGSNTWALTAITAAARTLLGETTASAQRTALGLAIGTDVQAYDADLAAIAALTSAANKMPYSTGTGTWALADLTAAGRSLVAGANAAAQRTTLSAAASGANSDITSLSGLTTAVSVAQGGTGSTTAADARTALAVLGTAGGTMTGLLNLAKGAAIASAGTVNLSTATGNTVSITGTTTITAWTMTSGQVMNVIFAGACQLTHHATTNNLPGSANVTTAANDRARFYYDGTTVYCLSYQRASGEALVAPAASALVPAGSVVYVGMSAAPTGYLKCNGAAVSRTTYADLFTAISTTFGVGDGTTTFNVPELRGEFIRGLDDSRGVDSARALGSAQSSANLAHTHTVESGGSGDATPTLYYITTGTGVTAKNTSSSGDAEARPRNVALLACIKF